MTLYRGAANQSGTSQQATGGTAHIATKSGKTHCAITQDSVTCEGQFTNSPTVNGQQANDVQVLSSGSLQWMPGNIGAPPDTVTLDYQTYHVQGWTIAADITGTRFTNDRTGHGMFVSIDNVTAF
jgi:hypothetical protein